MFVRCLHLLALFWALSLTAVATQASPCADFCRQQHERCTNYHCTPVTMGCSGGCSIFFTNNPNMCVDLCANDSLDACQRRVLDKAARCWQPCWQQKGGSLQQWGNCMKPCSDQARIEMESCRTGGGGVIGGPDHGPGNGQPGGATGGYPYPPPPTYPPTPPVVTQPPPSTTTGGPACPAVDLTGVWNGNDGGQYYIRQYGSNIWWYGEPDASAPMWTNVAYGSLLGGELTLTWADVPKGRATSYGSLVIDVLSSNSLGMKSQSGGFRGTRWTRAGASPPVGGDSGKKKKESLEDKLREIFRN